MDTGESIFETAFEDCRKRKGSLHTRLSSF